MEPLNSESDIIKNIADDYGIKFYKRPEEFSSDTASNDDWVLDFIDNVDCDMVFQFLATSPFTSPLVVHPAFSHVSSQPPAQRDIVISASETVNP